MTGFQHRNDLIGIFAQNKVAANLLMIIMLLTGAWGLANLNVQFFPNFELELVQVRTVWAGASAEDVERSLTQPLENALRSADDLDDMSSTSAQGVSVVTLEFPEGSDMGEKVSRVEELVNSVRNLPQGAERTEVTHLARYEDIARMMVYGPDDLRQLRPLVRRLERELLDAGISRVQVNGLPEEEIAIQVSRRHLEDLSLSLDQISQKINATSRDLPAGMLGRDESGVEMRTLSQRRDEKGFADLPIISDENGRLVLVGDVAEIERRARPNQVTMTYKGKPAVEMKLQRATTADSLKSAEIMNNYLADIRPRLPQGVELVLYDENWQLIKDRINLLLKNGLGGLILVVGILYLFLNGRVATWVTVGIPVSFMATLAVMFVSGGSINMISLFALIMALGIIVDDAIVVGEDALTHHQTGESSLEAAEGGARRMLAPVMSSSLTTIAAFIPLFVVSGLIGKFLGDIPFVIVCVILASLIESFLVLPGHLRHSFKGMAKAQIGSFRKRWDVRFDEFRDGTFQKAVTWAVDNRMATLAIALSTIILLVGLLAGGRMGFTFFPSVPGNIVVASASFVSGTPPERVHAFIDHVEEQLYETDKALGGGLVKFAQVSKGMSYLSDAIQSQKGDQFASVFVELIANDAREVTNDQFTTKWESLITKPPGLEYFSMAARKGGPPGRDLEIRLTGSTDTELKMASLELTEAIKAITGTRSVEDDLPFGNLQLMYELNATGAALGLSTDGVGRQLRAALDGQLVQIFNEGDDEIEVRVMLPDEERHRLSTLESFRIYLPNGNTVPLSTVVDIKERRGFKALRHADGQLAVTVLADVNTKVANANAIREQLAASMLPQLVEKYDVHWAFTGKAEDQEQTKSDMKQGALFALAMIYIVLAWVFSSYGWPLVVMAIIPFGIVGALMGHFFMGITPTILSMFGVFALSGIVVNDSIILVVFYKQLREKGKSIRDAVIAASRLRLRAVLLTSLTTIAGLLPLLFETSLQAQFLIPMAVSISFGLAFATFLVLFLVPALLSAMEYRLNPSERPA